MKTDNLIAILAADARAERSLCTGLCAWMVPSIALLTMGLLAVAGPRPDLFAAMLDPVLGLRIVLPMTLMLTGVAVALRLARPEARPGGVVWGFAAVAGLGAVTWLWALSVTPAGGVLAAMMGQTLATCLFAITAMSLVPAAVILATLRRGVVMRPTLGGVVAGLTGGGTGAMIYALHCTENSPLFFVTWYGVSILIVTGLSVLAAPFVLRA